MQLSVPMLLNISSPNLVVAMDRPRRDPKIPSGNDSIHQRALLNILSANDFDAIPLVETPGARPSRIARRRYHDGDPSDVFVFDVSEVSVFDTTATILEVLISVIGNEHHVALVEKGGMIKHIVTLETMAQTGSKHPYLRQYLDRKVSDVAIETGADLDAGLGRRIFGLLRELATLIDDDRRKIPDLDFTQRVIDILKLLQPLKKHPVTEVDSSEDSSVDRSDHSWGQLTAGAIMRPNMTGVMESDDQGVMEAARDILSEANDFSNILLFDQGGEPVGIQRLATGEWAIHDFNSNSHGQNIEDVMRQLSRLSRRGESDPIVVVRGKDGSFGAISLEEASSNQPAFWLLTRLVRVENLCRDWLVGRGIQRLELHGNGNSAVDIQKASFGQILHYDNEFSRVVGGHKRINQIITFRNKLVHKVIDNRDYLDLDAIASVLNSIRDLEEFSSSGDVGEAGPRE